MGAPSFAAIAPEYAADWARMQIRPQSAALAERLARRVAGFRDRYEPVAAATRVPWYLIGLLHMREASFDFTTHLHNGDPLTGRTTHVPAHRPVEGDLPFGWEESAIDALRYDRLDRVGAWPIEVIAFRSEGYNGFGPRLRGRKSGYLWAGSSIYDGGKFVADGRWDPAVWDKQLGVMTVLRMMVERGLAEVSGPSVTIAMSVARGHTDSDLQRALNQVLAGVPGFTPLVVDGSIGKHTRAAVRLFQARVGLDDDGVAGPLTWDAIETALGRLGN